MRIANQASVSKHRRIMASGLVIAGRYRIRQLLGRGGMGLVYLAWDTTLLTKVVIKQHNLKATNQSIPRHLGMQLFQREAAILGTLNHPSIPRLLDLCGHGDGNVIVMEHIDGIRLDELLAYRDLSFYARSEIAQQICYLVEFLHRQPRPIIHCDLETSHFIVRNRRVLLIDYGLARFVDDHTLDELIIAKAWYSPPEQCTGGMLDQRTDIYALGQTLRMIYGEAANRKGLSEVLERATNPLPHLRYQSVADLRVSLRASVEALTVRSRVSEPISRLQQHTVPKRNHRSPVARRAESGGVSAWFLWVLVFVMATLICSMLLMQGNPLRPLPLHHIQSPKITYDKDNYQK